MVCSAKQNYLQTPRSSTTLCQATVLSNQQTQLTISRNSFLSAEFQLSTSRITSFTSAEHIGFHQQPCGSIQDHQLHPVLICGIYTSHQSYFYPHSPLLGLPTFPSVTLSLQLTIRLLSPYNLCGLLQSFQKPAYSLLCPELHPGAPQQFPPKR